ncbi:MAG TPA: ribosome-associated translation inhibitor RaiA [Candidatus Saccharimonadales bacterium]|nr:ribosome-associated translation inhibitor RaiA [Candidatus Saccharimonadales bacterium]
MEVVITARHFKPSAMLREYVEEKFGRLSRFAARGQEELHVTLTVERRVHRVEATLGPAVVKHESDDIMVSIEKAADRLKETLRKHLDRRRERKGRIALKDGANGRLTSRRVGAAPRVRREASGAEEIDVDEAADRLAKSRKDFLVFVSSETGRVNVMYRRKDGQFGLIEPEAESAGR